SYFLYILSVMSPPPPRSTLFPYTTLFRSNDVLIRFCAAFLDQGLAHWPLPGREEGFFRSFCALYRQPGGPPARWLSRLPAELARDRKSTRLNSSHRTISYAVFCLKKKKNS